MNDQDADPREHPAESVAPRLTPSGSWYLLAIALCTLVPLCFGAGLVALGTNPVGRALAEVISGMFGGLTDPRLNNVETFPGNVIWQLDEAGPWNIRVAYDVDATDPPPLGALKCTLHAAESTATLELVSCRDEVPAYHPALFSRPRRSAEVFLFEIPAPGAYVFEAAYPDGATEPKIDLAASKGHSGEPLGIFWTRQRKARVLEGCAALSFCGGIVLALVVRRRRKRAAQPGTT